MKLRKIFRDHRDLSIASHAVETLATYYPPDATVADILKNVTENSERWEECYNCNGAGHIKVNIYKDSKSNKVAGFKFITCPCCKGSLWIRKATKGEK